MLHALLLATDPAAAFDHPAAKCIGGAVLFLLFTYPTLDKIYDRLFGGEKASLKAWQAQVDGQLAKFVPEGDIKAKNEELGRQIAELQGKIKTYHDAGESSYNALNMRTQALEQHNTSLTLLPGEVSNLKTDHRVLSAKVDTLTNSVEKLGEKQDRHHGELMQAVRDSAYTRGELHGGRRES